VFVIYFDKEMLNS